MAPMPRWTAAALALAALWPSASRAEDRSAPLDDPTLIALAVALAVSPAPQAGDVAAEPQPGDEGRLELVATVRAKTIVFDEVPKVNVSYTGSGPRRTVWKAERTNLPARVQPGVVYRDVTVRLTVRSTMEDMAVLLREAKGASRGLRVEPDGPEAVPASVRDGEPAAGPRSAPAPAAPAVIVREPARP